MKIWSAPLGLHIEMADSQDAEQLTKLHAEGFFRGWSEPDFVAYIGNKDTPIYVVCDKHRKIAGFSILRVQNDECELLTIVVSKRFRGKKLGNALMKAMWQDLFYSPVTKMFLEVDEDNESAKNLYAQYGFAQVGTRRGYYARPDGHTATALVMRADLS